MAFARTIARGGKAQGARVMAAAALSKAAVSMPAAPAAAAFRRCLHTAPLVRAAAATAAPAKKAMHPSEDLSLPQIDVR